MLKFNIFLATILTMALLSACGKKDNSAADTENTPDPNQIETSANNSATEKTGEATGAEELAAEETTPVTR